MKTLIFDLDGTLIDSRQDLVNAVNAFRKKLNYTPVSFDDVVNAIGDGIRHLVERMVKDHPECDIDYALELMRQYYEQHLVDCTTLYPGVKDGIIQLQQKGFKLALVSNKPQKACESIIQYFELTPFFSQIIGSGQFPLKPDPSALLYVLQQNHSDPESSWMVGDHFLDVMVGQAAQMKTCFVQYGFGKLKDSHPDLLVHSFSDFVHYLETNSSLK